MTKKSMNRQKFYLIGAILLVVLCFVGLLVEFSVKAFSFSEQLSRSQMKEMSVQTAQSVNIKVASEMNYISALSLIFAQYPDLHAPQTLELLSSITESSPFDRIRLTTPDGRSFAAPNNMIDISEREYFRAAMAGSSGVSDSMLSFYNNAPVLTVYAPIIQDGQVVGTIHGARELTTLSKALNTKHIEGIGVFYVIKKNGHLILKSDDADVLDASYTNLWRFLGNATMDKKDSIPSLQRKMVESQAGFFSYTVQNKSHVSYYMPLNINDWYLIHIVPVSSITAMSAPFQQLALTLVLRALLALCILGAIYLYFAQRSHRAVVNANRELRVSNERFRIAISHTPSIIFDYNIAADRITFEEGITPPYHLPKVIEQASSYILTQHILAEESVVVFQRMFSEIRSGAPSSTSVIKIQTQGDPVWERMMLTTIFDGCRRPLRTIGTIENITEQILSDLRRQQAEEHRRTLAADALWFYDINVTQDVYYKYDLSLPQPEDPIWMPYSSNVVASCHSGILETDRAAFMEIADRNRLMQAFEQNITELTCEYRILISSGSVLWMQSNSHLLRDPVSQELHCYTYVKNIQDRKERELALRQQAELDPLTGLYNRQAAERLISEALKDMPERSLHGFFSIDIDNFKSINDHFGHISGDNVLRLVAEECRELVRAKDIVARMGGDEFIIFLRDARNLGQIETIATRLCDHIRRLTLQPEGTNTSAVLSVSVGIAVAPQHGITFDELYCNSDLALYYAKQHGRNRHAVYFRGLIMEAQSS